MTRKTTSTGYAIYDLDELNALIETDEAQLINKMEKLVGRVRPIFVGCHPAIIGGVLAELVATLLAGMPPETRSELLELHMDQVRRLIPRLAREIRGNDQDC